MLSIAITIVTVWLSVFPPIGHNPEDCTLAGDKEKAALRYHGVGFAVWQDGVGTFVRDGKVCKLYNVHYENRWRGRK